MTPAAPTAAVIWTNGKRQVVGMAQTFDVGDATFKLVAVNDGAMRLQAAGGVLHRREAHDHDPRGSLG